MDDALDNMSPVRRRQPKLALSRRVSDARARALGDFKGKVEKLPDGRLKVALTRLVDPTAELPTPRERPVTARTRESADMFRARVKHLEALGPLLALDLSGSLIGRAGALALAELMYAPAAHYLRLLDLSGNQLTDMGTKFDGVSALATVIQSHGCLETLNLARNALYKQGAVSLARALATNTVLQILDVSRNNLRSGGVAAIADAISVDTNPGSAVTYLDVSENNVTNFSEAPRGAMALASAIRDHPSLTVLNLSHNRMERAALVSLALALEDNNVLVDLRLDANGVDPSGAASIADALKTNRSLTRLSMRNNSIRSTGCTALAEALKSNSVLRIVDLRENYISHVGRVSMAKAITPRAPSVMEAVREMEEDEAENDVRQPEPKASESFSSDSESSDEGDSLTSPVARKRLGTARSSMSGASARMTARSGKSTGSSFTDQTPPVTSRSRKSVASSAGAGGDWTSGGVVESKAGVYAEEAGEAMRRADALIGAPKDADVTESRFASEGDAAPAVAPDAAPTAVAEPVVPDVDLNCKELVLTSPETDQVVLL